MIRRKTGIPITLCILFMAVAERNGLRVVAHNRPQKLVVLVPSLTDAHTGTLLAVDVYSRCNIIGSGLQPSARVPECNAVDLCQRMARNLISVYHFHATHRMGDSGPYLAGARQRYSETIDFSLELQPINERFSEYVALSNRVHSMSYRVYNMLKLFPRQLQAEAVQLQDDTVIETLGLREYYKTAGSKSREPGQKWRVGQTMRHVRLGYTCVIAGWDTSCTASDMWKTTMGVYRLPRADMQPFYNVLVDGDQSTRYAAEDNLEPADDATAATNDNERVAMYFEHLGPNGCIPLERLLEQYPEDFSDTCGDTAPIGDAAAGLGLPTAMS